MIGEGRAGAVGEAASARRAAITLFLSTVSSVFMGSGIRAVRASWHLSHYPSTTLRLVYLGWVACNLDVQLIRPNGVSRCLWTERV